MSSDYAARTLKQILELKAQGATWEVVGIALKIPEGQRGERAKKAKRLAKETARVSQRTLAGQGIGLS